MEGIKTNELRIGNWYDHHGKMYRVNPAVIEEVWVSERSWCKPIPLTKEILLKCGFKKHITIDIYPTFVFRMININDGIVYVCNLGFLNHIKHLHQLQNLYFSLTNEELNIQL